MIAHRTAVATRLEPVAPSLDEQIAEVEREAQAQKSAPASTRPVALTPNFDGMPSELQTMPIWVVWRYQWDGKKKWKKVPYIPIAGKQIKAKSNDNRTWRSYSQARSVYLAGGFDGVGIVADDDLVFGDFDDAIDDAGHLSDFARDHMPPTYAELSVSGGGAHFIAHGQIDRPRKKKRGELYAKNSPRFLTMTGRRMPDQPQTIEYCQEAIDQFATALDREPSSARSSRKGTGHANARRDKSRKQLAAEIVTDDVLAEARMLYRTQSPNLERRFKAAAWKEETQWWCVSRREYATFHAKYPFVGLYDDAGEIDASQARMATGRAIRGCGFTLPEYIALMNIYFAEDRAQILTRWGNKESWHAELADVWDKSAPARRGYWQPKRDVAKKPKGRASDHHAQVERVYTIVREHQIGDRSVMKTADIASEAEMHRVTLSNILTELQNDGRIHKTRFGRYGGLIITFPDVAIVDELPIAAPAAASPLEDTHTHNRVSSETREAGYSSGQQQPTLPETLAEAVIEAIDMYGTRYVPAPGAVKPVERVVQYIRSNGGTWPDWAIRREYRWQLRLRSIARRDEREAQKARNMRADALKRKSRSLAGHAAKLAHQGEKAAKPFMHLAGIYAAEEARRAPPGSEHDELALPPLPEPWKYLHTGSLAFVRAYIPEANKRTRLYSAHDVVLMLDEIRDLSADPPAGGTGGEARRQSLYTALKARREAI